MEETSPNSVPAVATPPTAEAMLAMASAPLDAHARLLKMMLPRAQHVCIYSAGLGTLYQGEGLEPPEMRDAAQTVLKGPHGHPYSFDGNAEPANEAMVYSFCLREDAVKPLAVVSLFVPGTREARPFSLVLSLVRPALEVLQRELRCDPHLVGKIAIRRGDPVDVVRADLHKHVDIARLVCVERHPRRHPLMDHRAERRVQREPPVDARRA